MPSPYEVTLSSRKVNNKRIHVNIQTFNIESLFTTPVIEFKNNPPEIIQVNFYNISCPNVCNYTWGTLGGAIIIDLDDPIHSKLFPFGLTVNINGGIISVHLSPEQVKDQATPLLFARLLKICEKKFYADEPVKFHSRKHIKRIKRRYLIWVAKQGQPPDNLKNLAMSHYNFAIQQKKTIGELKDADKALERLIEAERKIQEL